MSITNNQQLRKSLHRYVFLLILPAILFPIVIEGEPAGLNVRSSARQDPGSARPGDLALANSDPLYRALRDATISSTYAVDNLRLVRDVATFHLRKGRISFLTPVMNRTVIAVFSGEAEFVLKPTFWSEVNHLKQLTGGDEIRENVTELVIVFTDQTHDEIIKSATPAEASSENVNILKRFHKNSRNNRNDNIEALLLQTLLCSSCKPQFSAYIRGDKYKDLSYFVIPHGVWMGSPEEVALLNNDIAGGEAGVWYFAHSLEELEAGTASSGEDRRHVDAIDYKIENTIEGERLTSICVLTFVPLVSGDRMMSFNLLPSLRVTEVTWEGKQLSYIQEDKDKDGSFHVIFPSPLSKNVLSRIMIKYQGKEVIENAGNGNFSVNARTQWYPRINSIEDRTTFDLSFRLPRKYSLIGSGRLLSQSQEGDDNVTRWVSEHPVGVAGFNFGNFKKIDHVDSETGQKIEVHFAPKIPDSLHGVTSAENVSVSSLADRALAETQHSIRIFTRWFGELPYGRIAITQQPQLSFGQSWPSLIYLPVISFLDSTVRFQMFGQNRSISNFVEEVTPHEVAHQWWGHMVGASTYHDSWLSEGFSEFSAGLFLQYTRGGKLDEYHNFWKRKIAALLEKNSYGIRYNDAGPVTMGFRVETKRTAGAHDPIVYGKGAYILHMLRWMMHDQKTGDKDFITMMQEYVKKHRHSSATTESFKYFVDRHIKPNMNLSGNGRMDWFFSQWVLGTEIPRYRMDYRMKSEDGDKTLVTLTVTQSDVSPTFQMPVPLYVDYDGKISRVGEIPVIGNMTTDEYKLTFPGRPKRLLINYHHDILATESVSQRDK